MQKVKNAESDPNYKAVPHAENACDSVLGHFVEFIEAPNRKNQGQRSPRRYSKRALTLQLPRLPGPERPTGHDTKKSQEMGVRWGGGSRRHE